jgi:hypothetical protein
MLSPSGENINNDTLEYLPSEVLTDIHALTDYFSMCISNINTYLPSTANKRRRSLEFEVGDYVYLKVTPMKKIQRFGVKS